MVMEFPMRITRNFFAYYENILITIHYLEIQSLLPFKKGEITHDLRANGRSIIKKNSGGWIKDAGIISVISDINSKRYQFDLEMIRSFSVVEYKLRVNGLPIALQMVKDDKIDELLAQIDSKPI
jgi:hypothetical protein